MPHLFRLLPGVRASAKIAKLKKKKNVWKVRENISKPRKTFKKVQQQLREKMVEKGQKNKAI